MKEVKVKLTLDDTGGKERFKSIYNKTSRENR